MASPAWAAGLAETDLAPVPSAMRSRTWISRRGSVSNVSEVVEALAIPEGHHEAPVADGPVLAVTAEHVGLFASEPAGDVGSDALADHRQDRPVPGDPGQLDVTYLTEADARTGNEVAYGARCQDLAWLGQVGKSGTDVHGDAAKVAVHDLALAGVDADPEGKAASLGSVADAEGSPDGAGGAIEGGQDAIAEVFDFLATEAGEMPPDVLVVRGQELTPDIVATLDDPCGRLGDVGEHQREQAPLTGGLRS
jgi:hypothetical protein